MASFVSGAGVGSGSIVGALRVSVAVASFISGAGVGEGVTVGNAVGGVDISVGVTSEDKEGISVGLLDDRIGEVALESNILVSAQANSTAISKDRLNRY
jgi:hypothetical protein